MAVERIIGLDFGTSTSFVKVKRYVDSKPFGGDRFEAKPVIFDGKGSIAVPTVVQRAGEHFWYGYEAEALKPGGTIYRNFKVDLESDDSTAQALAKEMTQKFFEHIYEKYDEQRQYFGEPSDIERTLVSYPAKWREETRRFMVEAAAKAGFCRVTGMDEATAAIGAVIGQNANTLQEKGYLQADVPVTLLLIDMGAGTTDLAVCRYTVGQNPKNEIIATWPGADGNILFGGREIDELLCKILTQLLTQSGLQEQIINNFANMRMGEIKSWKEYTVSDSLNNGNKVESCSVLHQMYMMMCIPPQEFPAIDRQRFEKVAHTYLKQYAELVNGCVAHASAKATDFKGGASIDLVVLTGGHSQWYFAKDILVGNLQDLGDVDLPQLRDDKERVLRLARPQETVSLGLVYSAMQPEIKSPMAAGQELLTGLNKNSEDLLTRSMNKEEAFNQYGNTCGNIVNGGYVAQQGDWIFYQNESDISRIYKIHTNGTGKTKVNTDISSNINVVGDWVYYTDSNGSIHKIHTDGTAKTKLNYDKSNYVNIANDWIYYVKTNPGKIYKISTDGTQRTKLNDDKSSYINVVNGWIYYANESDDGKIYKIRTDGTEKTKANDHKSSFLNVFKGWIYYINESNGGTIYKMRTNGTEITKLNDEKSNNVNVDNDWLYYTKAYFDEDTSGPIYKIHTDGTGNTRLTGGSCEHISIVGNWVYFITHKSVNKLLSEHFLTKMYRIRTDGTSEQLIATCDTQIGSVFDIFKL